MHRLIPFAGLVAAALALSRGVPLRDEWSLQELAAIGAMRLEAAGPLPADPSNAYEARADVAALGKAWFNDRRLSRDGSVSCASCHDAGAQFQDGRPLGQGLATGQRRTMPVMGAAHAPFLFWDGRKDSLWSQALGPLEDPAEHGGNRVALVRTVQAHYAQPYAAAFGALPPFGPLPVAASPNGSHEERAAWSALPDATKEQVNRVFANLGKAIAAYERQVAYGESRFDRYAAATLARDAQGQEALAPQEVRGLRLFVGRAQCATCHSGPMLTDHAFHNTGVPPRDPAHPDRGRATGVQQLLRDEFNCLGKYSDAKREQCGELQFLAADDPGLVGAFRTPGLRNVAQRAPYMHAGQFANLQQVLEHYARAPRAAVGHSELAQPGGPHAGRQAIRLSAADVADLAAFLGTLTGPVVQPR